MGDIWQLSRADFSVSARQPMQSYHQDNTSPLTSLFYLLDQRHASPWIDGNSRSTMVWMFCDAGVGNRFASCPRKQSPLTSTASPTGQNSVQPGKVFHSIHCSRI